MSEAPQLIMQVTSYDDVITEIVAELIAGWHVTEKDPCREECKICLENLFGTYTITTQCHHTFHRNCILKNLIDYERDSCPICEVNFPFLKQIPKRST